MHKRELMLLSFLFIYTCFVYAAQGEKNKRVTMKVISISDTSVTLESSSPCSPGNLIDIITIKGDITFKLLHRFCYLKYHAIPHFKKDKSLIPFIRIGDEAEGDSNPLYEIDNLEFDSYFWIYLVNRYYGSKRDWIIFQNESDLNNGKLPKGKLFFIDANLPPVSGYVCLLSPESDNIVKVFFPNNKPDTEIERRFVKLTGPYNLTYNITDDARTYIKPSFTNISLIADLPGPTYFVLLVSTKKRPLSDFLPKGHKAKYVTHDYKTKSLKEIYPWEIGPGFLQPGALRQEFKDVEFIPADIWATAYLKIEVENSAKLISTDK